MNDGSNYCEEMREQINERLNLINQNFEEFNRNFVKINDKVNAVAHELDCLKDEVREMKRKHGV